MEIIEELEKRFKEYGAMRYNYQGVEFIGIKNSGNGNLMAITFNEDGFSFEFQTVKETFKNSDLEKGASRISGFLKNELCAVEVYRAGKSVFGGTRENNLKSTDINSVSLWYAQGDEIAKEKFAEFFKNGEVEIKIFSWEKIEVITNSGKVNNK